MKHLSTRLSFIQASSGSVSGVFTPFFAAAMAYRGLSPSQIGLLLSTALILRAVGGPLSGMLADARNDRRFMMLVLYWIMLAGFGALCAVDSPVLIFLVAVTAYVAFGAATPLLESVSVRLAEHYDFDYGKVRTWASSLFVVMNVAGGVCIKFFSLGIIPPMLAVCAAACVIATLLLPKAAANSGPGTPFPVRFKLTLSETVELLRSPVFLIFLAAASFEQSSHAFYYGYGGLHWRTIGYSDLLIGIIWPIGVFAEITLFSFASRVQALLSPARLLFLGAAICTIRWTILAFDPPLPLVVFAQFLHGGTFALAHLGAMFFVIKAVPQRLAATGQSLYFVCSQGVMMGIMTLIAGALYARFDGRVYLTSALCGMISMGFSLLLAKRWHGERIIKGAHDTAITTI